MGIVQDLGTHHSEVANLVALGIHHGLGGPFAVVVLVLAAGLVYVLKRSAADALLVIVLTTAGWSLTTVMKVAVSRARPEQGLLSDVLVPDMNGFTSFPSGHTAFAVSLAIAVSLAAWGTRWRYLTVTLAVVFAVTVGVSRVYLGVHYPSDVFAAFVLSAAAVVLVAGLLTSHIPAFNPWRHAAKTAPSAGGERYADPTRMEST
ncbi:phosphatase PAP2 family protein [Paeniglutamicibacter antarcticus]